MSAPDKQPSSTVVVREVDPPLKDLSEKKQSFRRNVVSLAAELKEVRSRLASVYGQTRQKLHYVGHSLGTLMAFGAFSRHEVLSMVRSAALLSPIAYMGQMPSPLARASADRFLAEEAETKLKKMEREMAWLEKSLEERNTQLEASNSAAAMQVKELEDLRLQLSFTRATADASALAAQSAQKQCVALLKELEEKNCSLKEHEARVNKLAEQLDLLQKDLLAREVSQMQLKIEVSRIEHDIMQALTKAGAKKDCELRKILDEVSPKNFENINKLLNVKDQEIANLRDEISFMSVHWKLKTKELETQLEKHRRADQELKKKVLKLELCLQEARAQTRKLQRMGERRDKALKELRDQLAAKEQGTSCGEKHNFWETPSFKIVVSMSMLVLVMFSKR